MHIKKSTEWLRVYIFLVGLDGDFDQIYREVLQKDPILDIEECHSIVRQEAIRQTTFNSSNCEAYAFITKHRPNYPKVENSVDKSSLECTQMP